MTSDYTKLLITLTVITLNSFFHYTCMGVKNVWVLAEVVIPFRFVPVDGNVFTAHF